MESVIATREEIERFLTVQKYNRDSDSGNNYDYGFSSGYDNGSGFGGGYGSGFSNGSGQGDGVGSGDGSVSGDGFGCGRSDIHALNGNVVDYIDNVPTIITQIHSNVARGYIINDDLTLQSCYIAKVGSFFAHGKTLKDAIVDAEAKETEKLPIEKQIEKFIEVFGSLDSEHIGKKFYDWHHILTGSCKMGRDEFCKSHSIDLTQKYSVRYFLDITEKSYGGDVIKRIRETYEFGKK